MKWHFNDHTPIYLQATQRLKEDILAGVYPPGSRFPSVRDLAVLASINPNTMQKALVELERDGFIRSNRTTGREVISDTEKLTASRNHHADHLSTQYLASMNKIGFSKSQTLEILSNKEEPPCHL